MTESKPSRQVKVVAALIWRDGQVLVQLRPRDKAQGNLWEFPGGKVEAAESDAVALRRECDEELGVPVSVGSLVWCTRHLYGDTEVELCLYHAQIIGPATPRPRAAQALRWCAPIALLDLDFCPADIPVVRRLAAGGLRDLKDSAAAS